MNLEARLSELMPATFIPKVASALTELAKQFPNDSGSIAINSPTLGRVDLIITAKNGEIVSLEIVPKNKRNDHVLAEARRIRLEAEHGNTHDD